LAIVDDLAIPRRVTLEASVTAGTTRGSGPYSADFNKLVHELDHPLRHSLGRHDAVASALGDNRSGWIITHGEPKQQHLITATGSVLVKVRPCP
jgi:hypothetical protein